jgi:proline iminopeptidase
MAALEWCLWEDAHVSLAPGSQPSPMFDDAEFRYRFARLVTHYWRTSAFRGDSELLDRAHELQGIPVTLIHGRFDVSSPLETAVELSKKWEPTELRVMEDGGHGTGDNFPIELLAALDRIGQIDS